MLSVKTNNKLSFLTYKSGKRSLHSNHPNSGRLNTGHFNVGN